MKRKRRKENESESGLVGEARRGSGRAGKRGSLDIERQKKN